MIKDKGALDYKFDMDLTLSQITNITSLLGDTDKDGITDAQAAMNSAGDHGWYLTFSKSGEKVIERSITFNNAVLFTTYYPEAAVDKCEASVGKGRLYAVRISDGHPYVDKTPDSLTEDDRSMDLIGGPILPPPQVILEEGSSGLEVSLCVGVQCDLGEFLPQVPLGIMGYKWQRGKVE